MKCRLVMTKLITYFSKSRDTSDLRKEQIIKGQLKGGRLMISIVYFISKDPDCLSKELSR
jgi:hypothetical protein